MSSATATMPPSSNINDTASTTSTTTTGSNTTTLSSSDPIAVREWLANNNKKQIILLDKFLIELRRNTLFSSSTIDTNESITLQIIQKVVSIIRHIIGSTNWTTSAELLYLIKGIGREIHFNNGNDSTTVIVIDNIIRRLMAIIRDETDTNYQEESKLQQSQQRTGGTSATTTAATISNTLATSTSTGRLSLDTLLWALPQHVRQKDNSSTNTVASRSTSTSSVNDEKSATSMITSTELVFPQHYYTVRVEWKQVIMEAIQEFISDLDDVHTNINDQAIQYIHNNEIILTIGYSKSIELFLKSIIIKHKRSFHLVLVQTEDTSSNIYDELIQSLTTEITNTTIQIEITIINIASVYTIMSRVHKVFLPARAVLANGGLVSKIVGCTIITSCAHYYNVPVYCITPLYKLCPIYPHSGQDTFNTLLNGQYNTNGVGNNNNYNNTSNDDTTNSTNIIEFINPAYDYIEPDYINLYITNVGSFQPSFIYRMLAENYHTDDWDSFE